MNLLRQEYRWKLILLTLMQFMGLVENCSL